MAKKKKRTIVGSPLTPVLLAELGALDEFPRTPKDFEPRGDWVNTYRIWACHGYRESGNYNVGFLRIRRTAGKSDDSFTLQVHQQVVQVDGMLNVIDAKIKCLNNRLASPVQWHLSSHFINTEGKTVPALETEERLVVDGSRMTVETCGRMFERAVPDELTGDWCFFEAVQRLKFGKGFWMHFRWLEGLSVVKEYEHVSYNGVHAVNSAGMSLHRFDQVGSGVLPYEYWLDDSHRLQAVISMNKAYILDEQAEKAIRQRTEQLRKSYQRVKSARRKKS